MKQEIILGCMRINNKSVEEVKELIKTSLSLGINFFDNADIYGRGESEKKLGIALKELNIPRNEIIIQSKASIKPGVSYDASYDYIVSSVASSLERLNTTYLDYFLLHRPDVLLDAAEVARAFSYLYSHHMVRNFGVSNFTPMQIEYLQNNVDFKIMIDQIQLSIVQSRMIDQAINFNMTNDFSVDRTNQILDYAKLKNISLQAWSPFQGYNGVFLLDEKCSALNEKLDFYAKKYNVSREAMAVAWLLKIPCVSPVVGTTSPKRLKDIAAAYKVKLLHDEWYDIYLSAGHILP